MKYSEEKLIQFLKNNDSAAYQYLYDNYSGALHSIISKVISDEGVARDILQETFVLIWRNIEKYENSKGRLFSWMATIARNLSVDMVRSKGFRNTAKHLDINNAAHVHDASEKNNKHDFIGLRKKLELLSYEHIQLIEMAYFFGFTHEQISQKLQIPAGTVKTRLRSALTILRRQLEEKPNKN